MIARSKVSAEGQVTIPEDVSKKLGIGPGSEINWEEEDGKIVIRSVVNYSFADIHRIVFGGRKFKRQTVAQMDEGIRKYLRKKHARD